ITGEFDIGLGQTLATALTIFYSLSGTASNGADYTYLTGSVTIAAGSASAAVLIQPIEVHTPGFSKTVVLTLIPTNTYLVSPTSYVGTVTIYADPWVTAIGYLANPVGIDYSEPAKSLLVSTYGGGFSRIYTNVIFTNGAYTTNMIVTNWTGIGGYN